MEAVCKWQAALFDTDNHTIRANEMLDAGRGETCFAHPGAAISAGIVKSSRRLDHHVQAHQKTKRVLPTIVVDDGIIDDNRTTFWKRGERLGEQELLSCKIPIVQDVTHYDDIGPREFAFKKVACLEPYAIRQPLFGHKLLKYRLNLRKIETDPAEIRIRARQSDRYHALRGADIHETPVTVPAKLRGNRMRYARADSTHRGHEAVQDLPL